VLIGGGGADVLDGSADSDKMTGGKGNDIYNVDAFADVVTEAAGEGNDTILSTVSIAALASNVENIELVFSAPNATGNTLANAITGNGFNNGLKGLDGDDTLSGGGGNDALDGGAGSDLIRGGAGRDILSHDASGSAVFDYDALIDSTLDAGGRDLISVFAAGDKIDVSAIDANELLPKNQAFTFVGASAFTGAGQLRAVQFDFIGTSNDRTILLANVDGDATAEMQIDIKGLVAITEDNFIL
jgi:Ca2+-binding RTX toxin-like protein